MHTELCGDAASSVYDIFAGIAIPFGENDPPGAPLFSQRQKTRQNDSLPPAAIARELRFRGLTAAAGLPLAWASQWRETFKS